jgi:hypothetical protein
MSSEVIDVSSQSSSHLAPVTRQDMEAMKAQRELLKEFISSQLKEAQFSDSSKRDYGEGDFGIIPGTKKKSLLKPGAEKILRLFGLGARLRMADKEIDRAANFAMFTYRCEIYHLKTGTVIAECEGSTNSQETKYRERTVWKVTGKDKNGNPIRQSVKEETPICDVLNTLIKMAQKRALIGATILGTAASDYFTQDMEFDENPEMTRAETSAQAPAQSSEPSQAPGEAPVHCGKKMMLSKYPDRESGEYPWYCTACKAKLPSGVTQL